MWKLFGVSTIRAVVAHCQPHPIKKGKTMDLNKAMDEIAELNKKGGKGTTNLKGKTYTNVPTRVEVLRKYLGLEVGIENEVLFPVKGVVMISRIKDKGGFILATGHSYADNIQKEKSLEKLETVAIGRACAALGLSGGEFASDTEIESWKERYEVKPIVAMEKTGNRDIDYKHKEWMDYLVAYPKGEAVSKDGVVITNPVMAGIEAKWNSIHDDPLFGQMTAEQFEVLEMQYNNSRTQIERKK